MYSLKEGLVDDDVLALEYVFAEGTYLVPFNFGRQQHVFTVLADGVVLLTYGDRLPLNCVVLLLTDHAVQFGLVSVHGHQRATPVYLQSS